MYYLVSIYCLITAIPAVLSLLHLKLLLAFYIVCSSMLAVAVGDDLRALPRHNRIVQKMAHALMAVLMLLVALWLGQHFSISLYVREIRGTLWVLLGVLLGFGANEGIIERRKFRRR